MGHIIIWLIPAAAGAVTALVASRQTRHRREQRRQARYNPYPGMYVIPPSRRHR